MLNRVRESLSNTWRERGWPGRRSTSRRSGFERISVHELGRPHARMGNPNTGIPETLVQDLYDIYFIAAGTAMGELILFTNPVGQSYSVLGVTAFNKTDCHTNLTQSGMLDSSFTFIIRAVSVYVQALQGTAHPLLHPEDALNFASSFSVLQINRKPWLQGLIGWFPCGGGILMNGFGTLTAPVSTQVTSNGQPYRNNTYAIPGGIFINPQENFNFTISPQKNAGGSPSTLAAAGNPGGVVASGLSAWVRLLGQLTRVA